MTRLLDVNVLMALAWPQHIHHFRVTRWISDHSRHGQLAIATCPLTQLGFVRVSMNVRGYAADFPSASALLSNLVASNNFYHTFWPDDLSLMPPKLRADLGPNQLTDAYLAALAEHCRDGMLVTFDKHLKGARVEVIPD